MRVGLKSETGKVITASGVKPVTLVQWNRDNFWLYGVVEPLSGWQFTQEYPHLDTEHFQKFIDALSEQLGDDIGVIQLDQAGAHVTSALRWALELDSNSSTSDLVLNLIQLSGSDNLLKPNLRENALQPLSSYESN